MHSSRGDASSISSSRTSMMTSTVPRPASAVCTRASPCGDKSAAYLSSVPPAVVRARHEASLQRWKRPCVRYSSRVSVEMRFSANYCGFQPGGAAGIRGLITLAPGPPGCPQRLGVDDYRGVCLSRRDCRTAGPVPSLSSAAAADVLARRCGIGASNSECCERSGENDDVPVLALLDALSDTLHAQSPNKSSGRMLPAAGSV